jgi:sugar/nucleoside kinase (ribokinase family)
VLPLVDIFLPSIEEILLMLEPDLFHELTGASDEQGLTSILSRDYFSQIAEQLLQMGASIVGLKAGNRGLYLRTGDLRNGLIAIDREAWSRRELWAPCFKVDVVCTSGAGDATVAGFLAGLVHGLTPAQVLTAAVATGACKVKSIDTVGDIVSWRELQEQIAAGWDRVPLNIEGTGWRFDERESVWEGQHDFGITPVGKATTELQ